MLNNKYLLITDIKDFTLKSSLLPLKDLENILTIHDNYISEAKNYGWHILKNLGDWYLLYFDYPDQALNFLTNLFNKLDNYNQFTKDKLYKLELRVAGIKWNLEIIKTITWIDYTWKDLNLLNRIINLVPTWFIYVNQSFYNDLKEKKLFIPIWEAEFKGITNKINLYAKILSKETKKKFKEKIEKNLLLILKNTIEEDKSKLNNLINEIDFFIFKIASVGAIIVASPLPFIDASTVFFLQIYMFFYIWDKYNIKYDYTTSYNIIITFLSSLWYTYIKDWLKIWLFKIWLPWLWGYLQIPLAFWMLYWFWKLVNFYFYKKSINESITIEEIKNYFVKREKDWIYMAKKKKEEIIKIWRYYKSETLEKIKNIKQHLKELKL